MKKKLVSVVITYSHGMEKYIDEALESVFSQTYKPVETILIDDGSTKHETKEKLKEIKHTYGKKITVIEAKHQGQHKSLNTAIRAAKGTYICCLDSDDTLLPTYIEKTVAGFKKGKKIAIVATQFVMFGIEKEFINTSSEFNPVKILVGNCLHICSLFPKSVWKEVGGFSNQFNALGDREFWIKIVSKGYRWELIKEPLCRYRQRPNSNSRIDKETKYKAYRKLIEAHKTLYKKHMADVMLELMETGDKTLEAYMQTKGWKLLETIRGVKNKIRYG